MKKLMTAIALSSILALTAVTAAGCGLFGDNGGGKGTSVATLEELKENSNKTKIVLTADIDCDYEAITLGCTYFDGQGHSLKNGIINATAYQSSIFSGNAKEISNLTVENFSVTRTYQYVAIIQNSFTAGAGSTFQASTSSTITNVHLKNCKINVNQAAKANNSKLWGTTYVGGIYGGEGYNSVISGCSVEGMEIVYGETATSTEHNYMEDFYVGGIAGSNATVTNCNVKDLTVKAISNSIYSQPIVGGIIGKGSAKGCSVEDSTIGVQATWHGNLTSSGNTQSVSRATAGGLIGEGGMVENCYVKNTDIDVNCNGSVYAGGLVATASSTISQCLVADCTVKSHGINAHPYDIYRYTAGLAGKASGDSVTSCLVLNTTVEEVTSFENHDSKTPRGAGFIAIGSSTVNYCGAYNVSATGVETDPFSLGSGTVTNTYISRDVTTAKSVEYLEAEEWLGSSLQEKLHLSGEVWVFEEGKLPTMKHA